MHLYVPQLRSPSGRQSPKLLSSARKVLLLDLIRYLDTVLTWDRPNMNALRFPSHSQTRQSQLRTTEPEQQRNEHSATTEVVASKQVGHVTQAMLRDQFGTGACAPVSVPHLPAHGPCTRPRGPNLPQITVYHCRHKNVHCTSIATTQCLARRTAKRVAQRASPRIEFGSAVLKENECSLTQCEGAKSPRTDPA